jgi:Na+/proline symporter
VLSEQRLRLLSSGLMVAAVVVLVLAVIGAIQSLTSDSDVFLIGEAQEENRTAFAFAALIGGIASAGMLAGLGAILQVLLGREHRG